MIEINIIKDIKIAKVTFKSICNIFFKSKSVI